MKKDHWSSRAAVLLGLPLFVFASRRTLRALRNQAGRESPSLGPVRNASSRRRPPKKSGLAHLAILFKVLFQRILPRIRRRPRPRIWSWQFKEDINATGLGVARIPAELADDLRKVAEETWRAKREEQETGFARAPGLNLAFAATMSWHWASDAESLDAFRPAAEVFKRHLGSDWELVGASFVVADGGCKHEEAKYHLDFGPIQIPKLAAATALMPLYPETFPVNEGNLEYRPWDGNGDVAVHKYRVREAAIFDGKLGHRTQPFRAETFAAGKVDTDGNDLSGLRMLASFSLARIPPNAPWKKAVGEVMLGYGAPLVAQLG